MSLPFWNRNDITHFIYFPYSLDLFPEDLWFFPRIKLYYHQEWSKEYIEGSECIWVLKKFRVSHILEIIIWFPKNIIWLGYGCLYMSVSHFFKWIRHATLYPHTTINTRALTVAFWPSGCIISVWDLHLFKVQPKRVKWWMIKKNFFFLPVQFPVLLLRICP